MTPPLFTPAPDLAIFEQVRRERPEDGMGYRTVSVELSDAAVAKIDGIAAATDRSRDAVIAEAIERLQSADHRDPVEAAWSRLDHLMRSVDGGRSVEDIDAQVRWNRGED